MFKDFKTPSLSVTKWRKEDGATAVEYGLLVGLIAVFLIFAMNTLGTSVSNVLEKAACKVSGKTWTEGNAFATPPTSGTCSN